MKRVVSISLGSSKRDKMAELKLGAETILLERRGCDGNEQRARALFARLDGQVDALGVGGVELHVRLTINATAALRLNLVQEVKKTLAPMAAASN
jgi:hypothetical protein